MSPKPAAQAPRFLPQESLDLPDFSSSQFQATAGVTFTSHNHPEGHPAAWGGFPVLLTEFLFPSLASGDEFALTCKASSEPSSSGVRAETWNHQEPWNHRVPDWFG